MNTYLLTWNPKRWKWESMSEDIAELKQRGFFDFNWSCGRNKRIKPDDRLFLLRQGVEPRGILASGVATSKPFLDEHWDDNRTGETLYVEVRFDSLLDPETDGVLPLSDLRDGLLGSVYWYTQSSGISISPLAAEELENRWRAFLKDLDQLSANFPDEISTLSRYKEGVGRTVTVNAYERNLYARKACIDHYGAICVVCGFDFGVVYGELGRGFIHVHHLIPLSTISKAYNVDPIKDLRPVCPNCHAMLHKGMELLSIEQLKEIVGKNQQP